MVFCPECETDLDIEEDDIDEGEVVSCPECGSDFEVITINPVELKPVEEEYEEEEGALGVIFRSQRGVCAAVTSGQGRLPCVAGFEGIQPPCWQAVTTGRGSQGAH